MPAFGTYPYLVEQADALRDMYRDITGQLTDEDIDTLDPRVIEALDDISKAIRALRSAAKDAARGVQRMSTRCNIVLTTNCAKPIWLYHHCDGYIEGVGARLAEFLRKYVEEHNEAPWPDMMANDLVKNNGIGDDGYEITTGQHGDIEYLYRYDKSRVAGANGRTVAIATLRVESLYEPAESCVLFEYRGEF